jgi:hypothetical protein
VAVGYLREKSAIRVYDINTGVCCSVLEHHTDMIDSMLEYKFPEKVYKTENKHV